jgi:hypothetical protein
LHPDLTLKEISKIINFDPSTQCSELRPHPALDIKNIYQTVGICYDKSKEICERIITSLDIAKMYCETCLTVTSLGKIVNELDVFFG